MLYTVEGRTFSHFIPDDCSHSVSINLIKNFSLDKVTFSEFVVCQFQTIYWYIVLLELLFLTGHTAWLALFAVKSHRTYTYWQKIFIDNIPFLVCNTSVYYRPELLFGWVQIWHHQSTSFFIGTYMGKFQRYNSLYF